MAPNQFRAHIRWIVPLTGQQVAGLPGSKQWLTAKLADARPDVTFSVGLQFPGDITSIAEQDITLFLLAPDRLPDVIKRMEEGCRLIVLRGPTQAAECEVYAEVPMSTRAGSS